MTAFNIGEYIGVSMTVQAFDTSDIMNSDPIGRWVTDIGGFLATCNDAHDKTIFQYGGFLGNVSYHWLADGVNVSSVIFK